MGAPSMIYGTAWKEDATERLVAQALQAGFRGLDTANQRKHYHEAAVGASVREALRHGMHREDLFLQTKFTHAGGQDHRLPYDPKAPIAKQVQQSFASSLEHLGVDAIDSYLLHGPSAPVGLADGDWEAWRAMEDLQRSGAARLIGVSNVNADQLDGLCAAAKVQPAVVQNRTYTRPHGDRAVRDLCWKRGIAYQGFSLLTGAPRLTGNPVVHAIARRLDATVPQVVFAHAFLRNVTALTGTTSREHMQDDLDAGFLPLTDADLAALDAIVG